MRLFKTWNLYYKGTTMISLDIFNPLEKYNIFEYKDTFYLLPTIGILSNKPPESNSRSNYIFIAWLNFILRIIFKTKH